MRSIMESNNTGVMHYAITEVSDVGELTKRGIATGSSATLYTLDGEIRIWNFISKGRDTDGEWIEMI